MAPRRELIGALAACLLTACAGVASGSGAASPAPGTIPNVGNLPGAVEVAATAPPEVDAARIPPQFDDVAGGAPGSSVVPVAAGGNRVLMIGDSILASTSSRYTGLMCAVLVPAGWEVLVEAEVSRAIDFARTVQQARLAEGWDVGLIALGTNYGGDPEAYLRALDRAVAAFGDVPVVVVNVTQRDDRMRQVNEAIGAVAVLHPNVSVVDWRLATYRDPALLIPDRIHPSDAGREALVAMIAEVLGEAPQGEGSCLRARFTDDGEGLPAGAVPSSTAKPRPRATTTTSPGGASSSGASTSSAPGGGPGGASTTTSPGSTVGSGPSTTSSGSGGGGPTTTAGQGGAPSSTSGGGSGGTTTAPAGPPGGGGEANPAPAEPPP